LGRRLPGFKYSIFDYYHAILDRVSNPKKYGFMNGTSACYTGNTPGKTTTKPSLCSDPSKYVWFDSGHTTEACNWQLSKLIWKGKKDIVSPYNVKQLYELL
ncbi:GDSL esterase/lipase 4-like protein, partial [Drosera capensis]